MSDTKTENAVIVKISATFDNIWMYVIDEKGSVWTDKSSALLGIEKFKRTSDEAAKTVSESIIKELKKNNVSKIIIKHRGLSNVRDVATKTFQNSGIEVLMVKDITPIPHNGCRPKKNK